MATAYIHKDRTRAIDIGRAVPVDEVTYVKTVEVGMGEMPRSKVS